MSKAALALSIPPMRSARVLASTSLSKLTPLAKTRPRRPRFLPRPVVVFLWPYLTWETRLAPTLTPFFFNSSMIVLGVADGFAPRYCRIAALLLTFRFAISLLQVHKKEPAPAWSFDSNHNKSTVNLGQSLAATMSLPTLDFREAAEWRYLKTAGKA